MSALSKRVAVFGLCAGMLLLLPGASWLGKKGGPGRSLTGADGNGARIEMDINAVAMTCGATPSGDQMCLEFRDDGTINRPLVFVQKEGETAYTLELQHKQIMLNWSTICTDDELCCTSESCYGNSTFLGCRDCDHAGAQDELTHAPIPDGWAMYPLAVGMTAYDTLGGTESGTLFLAYCAAGSYRSCACDDGDSPEECVEMTFIPIEHFGNDTYCVPAEDMDVTVIGDSITTSIVAIPAITGHYSFVTAARSYCDDQNAADDCEPCALDSECTGTCDVGAATNLQFIQTILVDLFYVIAPVNVP